MIPTQILRVLATIRQYDVRALLMGGQACVLYGAAEYSRDLDLAVMTTPEAMPALHAALGALNAMVIAVPPFAVRYLERGHAVHFSDVMALEDLVAAKKTQRDKDWPMLRRLVDASYAAARDDGVTEAQVEFWLAELRSPAFLLEVIAIPSDRCAFFSGVMHARGSPWAPAPWRLR